jgi:prepilin peptidase CpaA
VIKENDAEISRYVRTGGSMTGSLVVVLLIAMLAIATCADLRSSRIPNAVSIAGIGIGAISHAYLAGFQGLLFSLAGLGVGFGLFFILYVSGGIGAGDVKLMSAVGAMLGPYGAVISVFLAILCGGVYAILAMSYHWGLMATGQKLACATKSVVQFRPEAWAHELKLPFRLRYGLAITGGTLLFLSGLHPFAG